MKNLQHRLQTARLEIATNKAMEVFDRIIQREADRFWGIGDKEFSEKVRGFIKEHRSNEPATA